MRDQNLHRFGPFLVIRTLGRGGMGEVFIARTPWPNHPLAAVKRLRPDVARVPTFAERFAHEAELAVRLKHANVVATIDVGSVDGQLYVAADLVYGKDTGLIADRLRERGQGGPAAVGIRLLIDTLSGLAYVHGVREPDGKALRLVHRDVTPGNVLVGYDGSVRLADFGLAKSLLTEKSNLTNHGEILGTPHYLAPEVIRGDHASPASDLYGVGAVMYRFLTGIAPHQGTTAEVLLKVLSEEPRPLSDLRPDLAPWLVSFVHRLLEKDPSRRPYDALLLLQQLSHDAKASGLLVNKSAVGRWLGNLFQAEKDEELEERDRLVDIDPEELGGHQEGTVVLARPGANSVLEAPQAPAGASDDEGRDSQGTELDLSEAQVRAIVGQIDPRLSPTDPPKGPTVSAVASGGIGDLPSIESMDAMPTRAVTVWPEQQPITDAGPPAKNRREEDTLDPITREDPDSADGVDSTDERTRLGPILSPDVNQSGPSLPGFVDGHTPTHARPDSFEPFSTAPEPDSTPQHKTRPRNKGSVVVGPAPPGSRPPQSEPEWRPDPQGTPDKSPRSIRPQPIAPQKVGADPPPPSKPGAKPPAGASPQVRPAPAQNVVRMAQRPAVQVQIAPLAPNRRSIALLAALLTVAVVLGVGIGSFIASLRIERRVPVAIRTATDAVVRQRFAVLQQEMNARKSRGEALPARAWELYGAAATALVEGKEAVVKQHLDEIDVLLADLRAKAPAAPPVN